MTDDRPGVEPHELPYLRAAFAAIVATSRAVHGLRLTWGVPVAAEIPMAVLDAVICELAAPLVAVIEAIDDPAERGVAVSCIVGQLLRNFALHAPALGSDQWNKNEQLTT